MSPEEKLREILVTEPSEGLEEHYVVRVARAFAKWVLEDVAHEIVCEATDPCQFRDAEMVRALAAKLDGGD